MENWEAKLEQHWEAFLLYVWGLIALTGLYASVDLDDEDRPYPRDLTAEDIMQELALREMERLSLEANPRRFVHIRVNGWRGLVGQPRLDSGLRHPMRLASGGPAHPFKQQFYIK